LCAKLRDLEGGDSKDEQEELSTATDAEAKVPFETLTPRDRALRYYAAFPALQPITPKKFPYRKERNLSNSSSSSSSINNNNKNNNNNNKIIIIIIIVITTTITTIATTTTTITIKRIMASATVTIRTIITGLARKKIR
jgi:hypothetical protein